MFVGVGVGVGRQRFDTGGGFIGLLDLYPSATFAYSLRKLSSTYTGNAIRVRRASDNNEQNIGFDALGNLDTTALTAFCSGTNGFVTTWYDQSGNGNSLIKSVAIDQPKIVASGAVIVDSDTNKPTLQFTTQKTSLHTDSLTELPFNANYTFVFVMKANLGQTYSVAIADAVGDNQDGILIFDSSFRTKINNTNYTISGSANNRGNSRLWSTYRNSINTVTTRRNGANYGSVASATGSFDFVQIGSNVEINPPETFTELIAYEQDKSSDVPNIELNINDYYAIY